MVYRKGNPYLTLRDELGVIYGDTRFAHLFVSPNGRPAESPGNLALVTVVQYLENLSDRQAAEEVRGRIDLKYLLGLEIDDPGFDYTLLHDFRQRLLENGAERELLDALLELLHRKRKLKERGRQRTDSTHVLASVRKMNRLELVGETLRYTLNSLAAVVPAWLQVWVAIGWFDRYAHRFEQWRLPNLRSEREALAVSIGQDGLRLLEMVDAPDAPQWLKEIPAIQTLRQVWEQQYKLTGEELEWRTAKEVPPRSEVITSPYDTDARFSKKRSTEWNGYKVHVTETCDDGEPRFITNVETTVSTVPDIKMTEVIHQRLDEKGLLPSEHYMDAGYVNAPVLAESQHQLKVDVVGPAPKNTSWQAKTEGAYDVSCFSINWDTQRVTCPAGHINADWNLVKGRGERKVIHVRFSKKECLACPERARCTKAKQDPRSLSLLPQLFQEALDNARQREKTPEYKEAYKRRAGVEGTISLGVRKSDLRRTRYRNLAKTRLQHLCMAAAINLARYVRWAQGVPLARTRTSAFARLAPA